MPCKPLAGEIANGVPLLEVCTILTISGAGCTVTITENAAPTQFPTRGVTKYVAVCAKLVRFSRLPVINVGLLVADTPPVKVPVNIGTLQVYKMPSGTMPLVPLVGVITNGTPLQVTVVIELISAVGGNVTVTVKKVPTQPDGELGVTINVAVWVVFVRLFSKPDTIVTLLVADDPPVTVPEYVGTVQVYLVN